MTLQLIWNFTKVSISFSVFLLNWTLKWLPETSWFLSEFELNNTFQMSLRACFVWKLRKFSLLSSRARFKQNISRRSPSWTRMLPTTIEASVKNSTQGQRAVRILQKCSKLLEKYPMLWKRTSKGSRSRSSCNSSQQLVHKNNYSTLQTSLNDEIFFAERHREAEAIREKVFLENFWKPKSLLDKFVTCLNLKNLWNLKRISM